MFFRKKTVDDLMREQLHVLKSKMDLLCEEIPTIKFDTNYRYMPKLGADMDLASVGYRTDLPILWSQKYQFLIGVQKLQSMGRLTQETLSELKNEYPRALDGIFSETKRITNLLSKELSLSNTSELAFIKANRN